MSKMDWDPNENQGRSKEHVERNYMAFKILAWFGSVLIIVLVTSLIVKYIAE